MDSSSPWLCPRGPRFLAGCQPGAALAPTGHLPPSGQQPCGSFSSRFKSRTAFCAELEKTLIFCLICKLRASDRVSFWFLFDFLRKEDLSLQNQLVPVEPSVALRGRGRPPSSGPPAPGTWPVAPGGGAGEAGPGVPAGCPHVSFSPSLAFLGSPATRESVVESERGMEAASPAAAARVSQARSGPGPAARRSEKHERLGSGAGGRGATPGSGTPSRPHCPAAGAS